MNNDLKKEAVVDTGTSATAAVKKKPSGQGNKSSRPKSAAGKNTSQKPYSGDKAPAKKKTQKSSDSAVKPAVHKSSERSAGNNTQKPVKKKTAAKAGTQADSHAAPKKSQKPIAERPVNIPEREPVQTELERINAAEAEEFDEYEISGVVSYSEDISDDEVLEEENTQNGKKKKRNRLLFAIPIVTAVVILSAGVVVSSAALGIFDTVKHEEFVATKQSNSSLSAPQGKFLEGISVQGVDLGGKTMKQAKEMLSTEESKLIPSINYTVTCHDKIVYLTEDDFEFKFDTVKVLNEAYEYSEYMREVLMDKGRAALRRSEKREYTITMQFPEESIKTACEEVAKKVNVEMENAHVTNIDTTKDNVKDMFSFAEGVVGYSVDVDDLVTQIDTLKKNENFDAEIIGQMEVVEPTTDLEDLLKNLVLISKYETYSGNTWAGNMNMTVAMESMTGSIIKPGEVFSFNGKTGDSNLVENGYYSAGVIVNGRSADGIGGGICQAATTIYNAAIRAGMTIVEREPHTWPSVYVPVGIDSAIDYGSIDMKFRNDTEHEVYLICYMDGYTLHAYIYGYKPSDFDEIVVSSWFTGGSGIGFGASACRNYYKGGKLVKTEDLPDSFYSNGGGSSYAYDEPLANYKFERVFTDKQAAKLAAKIEEETKTKATKDTEKASSDTDKDKSKAKDSDKDESTATNDNANLSGENNFVDYTEDNSVDDVAANAYIEDTVITEEPVVEEDFSYDDGELADEVVEEIPEDDSLDEDYIE